MNNICYFPALAMYNTEPLNARDELASYNNNYNYSV